MKLEQGKEIANALLYEGYLLYPYRRSAIKNRQRWTFGVVYPREYSEAQGGIDPWLMQTECLVLGTPATKLNIMVRFLHLLIRSPSPAVQPGAASGPAEPRLLAYQPDASWQEGVEREVALVGIALGELAEHPRHMPLDFPGECLEERQSFAVAGSAQISAQPLEQVDAPTGARLFRLTVQIENTTPGTGAVEVRHEAIVLQSFVSTHTIMQVQAGRFVSLLEPTDDCQAAAQSCHNERTWPVLVGNAGEVDSLLSSPIILYDYPQIAPESIGPLFDGTEIDEILILRILTLTDEEKAEIRQGDERARAMLERVEAMTAEELMQLHGTIRSKRPLEMESLPTYGSPLDMGNIPTYGIPATSDEEQDHWTPWTPDELEKDRITSIQVGGRELKVGDAVLLRPSARDDAMDMLLAGKTARIEEIRQDYEDRIYLMVALDDDPGREQEGERVMPGHRFFFFPEEVELLGEMPSGWQP
jgi:hypothetical protein